ncbi:MAG: fused MFS/spermidine synthase [Acidobacteriia bacterium]|nr:fused MFS/spermidine synthase [Terriglobia bacterium]
MWFQLLELVIGSTAISLAILLATFMGGMCLGSLILPRLLSRGRHPLRVYALLEFGICVFGVLVLYLVPLVRGVYTAWSGYGPLGFLLRGFTAGLCLLPPTLFMGATLPALARQSGAAEHRVSWLGLLYAANVAGAVLGCLLSGFYLLRNFDVAAATYVAAALNVLMGATAVVLAARWPRESDQATRRLDSRPANRTSAVYIAIALSGLCGLAAEAIWTRILGLLFGASVYALAIILAVFLTGLGVGSGIGALLCRVLPWPRAALGWCQWLAAGAVAWAAYNLSAALPYWPVNPSISQSIWFNFELDLARAFWTLLPATLLWGASFPLALAAAPKAQDGGRLMARVYAANTFGAIIGAPSANLLLVPWFGSQRAQQVLIALAIIAGLLVLLPSNRLRHGVVFGGLGLVAAALFIRSVPPVSNLLIAYGRYAATWAGKSDIIYAQEGLNSSVAVSRFPNGALTFHVAGKIQASSVPRDMRLQRMLGHLTTLTASSPRSVLVIGCGAGVTAGAVSVDPRVERETIIEIEPLVPKAARLYFSDTNYNVLDNSKVQVRIDDGRHYLTTTKERFDGITIDPLDPWVKGAANLYTKEFLEMLRQHLNPGGVVTMYIQLFETDPEAVKSSAATFFEVFPNGTIWGNPYQGRGHDMVLLGQAGPLRIDLDEMEQRIGYRTDSRLSQSLMEVGMNSPVDLFATYAGRKSDLTDWLRGAPINRDTNLRMQYLAGLGLNLDDAAKIYAGILAHRRFPTDIFFSTEGRLDSLRAAMQRGTQ